MKTSTSATSIRITLVVFTTIVSMLIFRTISEPMKDFSASAMFLSFVLCFGILPMFVIGLYERALSKMEEETRKKASREAITDFFETLSRFEDKKFHDLVMSKEVKIEDNRGNFMGTTTVSMMMESKKEEFLKTLK